MTAVDDTTVRATLPHDAARVVVNYTPAGPAGTDGTWGAARPAAVTAVVAARPRNESQAKNTIAIVAAYLIWVLGRGYEPDDGHVWQADTIDEYVETALRALADTSRSSHRSRLRAVGRAVDPLSWPSQSERISRKNIARPYTDAELALFVRAVDTLSTDMLRHAGSALIAACAGGGLAPADLRTFRGMHVRVAADGATEAEVQGTRPRTVVVLDRWADRLNDAAAHAGKGLLLGDIPGRRNISGRVTDALRRQCDVDIQANRLRSTWLAHHLAAGTPVKVLARAAGIRTLASLSDLLDALPDPDPATARNHLRNGTA